MKTLQYLFLVSMLVLSVTASSQGAALQGGDIDGVVTVAGSNTPIPGVVVTLSSGPMDPISMRALQIAARLAGVNFAPSTVQGEAVMYQSLTNAALGASVSPGSGDLSTALHNFREQTAKFKAVTGSDGRFAIRGVPPGQYTARAERDGFMTSQSSALSLNVPGATAATLSLVPGATIGGRIRDDDGEFLPNATVQAFAITYANGYPTLSAVVTGKTNFRGEYRLFWMKSGEYLVAATRDGVADVGARTFFPGTPELKSATAVSLKTGDNVDGVDFTISDARLARISGEVLSRLPPPDLSSAGLPPGLELPKDFMPPVELMLVSRDPNTPDSAENPVVETLNLENGRSTFQFTAPPGAYDLYAAMPLGGTAKIPLDVGKEDISGISLTIQAPFSLNGAVNLNGTTADLTKLRFIPSMDGNLPVGGAPLGVNPGSIKADGSFSAPLVLDGRYRPNVLGLPAGTYVSDVRQGGASVFDAGFVGSPTAPPVEIVLSAGVGIVRGVVQDASGKPISNISVSLVPAESKRQNRVLYRAVNTNTSGQFTFANLIPGSYKLFAWLGVPNGSYMNATFLARYEEKGKPVTVEAGGNQELNLTLANEP